MDAEYGDERKECYFLIGVFDGFAAFHIESIVFEEIEDGENDD